MATEVLKTMKEQLVSCVQGQLGDISKVDTHELGEAIDMIKDLSEAIYYCTITDSMEKSDDIKKQGETNINYYTTPSYNYGMRMYPDYRDMERMNGYMYYPPASSQNNDSSNMSYYTETSNMMQRDPR